MKKPPKKLSKLMRLALGDLAKVERGKKYIVKMGEWHSPDSDGCHVCFAGSVMAKTLNAPIGEPFYPLSFGVVWAAALVPLDHARSGILDSREVPDRYVKPYSIDPKQWRKDMWKIVRELEAVGE